MYLPFWERQALRLLQLYQFNYKSFFETRFSFYSTAS